MGLKCWGEGEGRARVRLRVRLKVGVRGTLNDDDSV